MYRLLLLPACLLLVPAAVADDTDPEPSPGPDAAVKKLDDLVRDGKADRDTVERRRKEFVDRLEKMHATLVKNGKTDQARKLRDRILLADSIQHGQALDTKLAVPKLLEKASSNGKYRELLHVLYVPNDRNGYGDFSDYGIYQGNSYAGYNNLQNGYWVYVAPRWYIWKDLK